MKKKNIETETELKAYAVRDSEYTEIVFAGSINKAKVKAFNSTLYENYYIDLRVRRLPLLDQYKDDYDECKPHYGLPIVELLLSGVNLVCDNCFDRTIGVRDLLVPFKVLNVDNDDIEGGAVLRGSHIFCGYCA